MNGTTYFIHAECGNNVYLDVSDIFKILTTFGIGKTVLRIKQGTVKQVKEASETVFYCLDCGKNIGADEVRARCFYCGNIFSLKDLFTMSKSGGAYCLEDTKQFINEDSRKLITIVKRMSFKV